MGDQGCRPHVNIHRVQRLVYFFRLPNLNFMPSLSLSSPRLRVVGIVFCRLSLPPAASDLLAGRFWLVLALADCVLSASRVRRGDSVSTAWSTIAAASACNLATCGEVCCSGSESTSELISTASVVPLTVWLVDCVVRRC